MIRSALQVKQAPLLLLYATKNADKQVDDKETMIRVKLMEAFAKTTSGLTETKIGLTKEPYFVDKFRELKKVNPDMKQSYIVGYDTLVRIMDSKYYPGQDISILTDFFAQGDLLCALREEHSEIADQEAAIKAMPWSDKIKILKMSEGKDVSSTRLREAVRRNDDVTMNRYLTPDVYDYIKQTKLYSYRDHILNCVYSNWHARFSHVSSKARVIKLSKEFIDYLHEDGIIMPDFPELTARIEKEIELLGPVIPKMNWSSPRDATWITADRTMKCRTADEIYTLLKASDYIAHDLKTFEEYDISDYELVLVKWFNAQPSMEFRCFVKDSRLVGICQRDATYYDFLAAQESQITDLAKKLFEEIRSFDTNCKSSLRSTNSVVFDMYASVDHDKAWLVDMNPYCEFTDPLLFTWDAIPDELEFRLIKRAVISPQYTLPYEQFN